MKKVIDYLELRKVAINSELDKLPPEFDQYILEVVSESMEELRQIDQALLILSNVVFSESELKAKLEEQKEEIRQWLIDEDFEGLAEIL
jgi:hypothetical protein